MWTFLFLLLHVFLLTFGLDPPTLDESTNNAFMYAENFVPSNTVTLYTAKCTDPQGDPVTFSVAADNGVDWSKVLSLEASSGKVNLLAGARFDYETVPAYQIWIQCTSTVSKLTGVAHTAFTLTITNVNEAPTSTGTNNIQINLNEGIPADPAYIIQTGFAFVDVDAGDTLRYTVEGPGANRVAVTDPSYPGLQLKSLLDYEINSKDPCQVIREVATESSGQYSAIATLTLCINDLNDNSPIFSQTTYTSTVDLGFASKTGATLATVVATDADGSSPNNQITFSMDTTDANGDYFRVSSGGALTLAYPIDLEGGGSISARILAKDGGTPANTATATFVWGTITTMQSGTTTEGFSGYCFFCKSDNLIAFIVLMVLAGIIAALLIYGIYRYCTTGNFLPDFMRPEADEVHHKERPKRRTGRRSTSPLNDDDDYMRSISRGSVATPSKISPNYKGY